MDPDKQKTCYIYCRVSTDRQAKEGYSLDAQKDICRLKAKDLGADILDTFIDEGQTATISERDEFMRMLNQCEKDKVDYIIVYNTDRFARNTMDHFIIKDKLRKLGTSLISVIQPMLDDSPEGKLMDTFLAGMNQFYSDDLGRKTKSGLNRKWDEGWWPGWAPLGYKNVRGKDKKGIVLVDKKIGPLIKLAFDKYATGRFPYKKLAKYLYKKGLRTRNDKPVAQATLQQILVNPFYYGIMRWNGMEKKGRHKPLINKALFNICLQVAAKHRNFIIRSRKHDFLLRGTVYCSFCGQRMTAEYHYDNIKFKRRGGKIGYYHCMKKTPCKSPYIEVDSLEKLISKHLKNIKFSKTFTDAVTRKVAKYLKEKDSEEASIRKRLLNKRLGFINQRSVLEQSLLDKTVDRETFKRLHDKLAESITGVDTELANINNTRNFSFDLLEECLALTRNIRKTYQEAPQFLKRNYLRFFFNRLYVNENMVVETEYSPLVNELINQQMVILRKNWLLE